MIKRGRPARDYATVNSTFRMPSALRAVIAEHATKHGRSTNSEIIKRLSESFTGKPRIRVPMGRATQADA